MAEHQFGEAKGFRNIVVLNIGDGVGAAVMLNDEVELVPGQKQAGAEHAVLAQGQQAGRAAHLTNIRKSDRVQIQYAHIRQILSLIQSEGELSRAQAAARAGMNVMTVGRIVENMISWGILQERETATTPTARHRSCPWCSWRNCSRQSIIQGSARSGTKHIILNPAGKICECGKAGCLQTYLSQRMLLAEARAVYPQVATPAWPVVPKRSNRSWKVPFIYWLSFSWYMSSTISCKTVPWRIMLPHRSTTSGA